jgi:uncharacterized delta-60 repeat protein
VLIIRALVISIFFIYPLMSSYAALDTSFNNSGFTFNSTSWTHQQQTCTAVQPDGKILVAGNAIASPATASQVAVVRFNTDGSLDTTFNSSGQTPGTFIYSIPGLSSTPYTINSTFGIALQSNGSIILTGNITLDSGEYPGLFILKLLNSGTLDTSFGIGGTTGITTNPGTGSLSNYVVYGNTGSIIYFWGDTAASYAILPQDDNKIVIAGQIANANATCFRFLSTGALDTTANNGSGFGSANASSAPGYLSIPSPYPNGTFGCLIKALTIDSSGNIYMAGQYNQNGNTSSLYYPVIYQCSAAGVLNNNYGTQLPNASYTGAVISTNTSTIQGSFNNIVVQPDGKAIAIGTATFNNGTNYYMTIARFTTAGQLDTTFGNGQGYIINTICSTGAGISLHENAQLLVTGQLASDPSYAVLLRYNNDGTLDTTFTPNGYITFNNLGYSNTTLGLDSTSDGKIHLGATFTASSTNQFGALQLLGSNVLQGNASTVVAYGYNANFFTQFLYVDTYAQIIANTPARTATISAVNTILQNYQTDYAAQPNFNYLLYLYLIKTELSQAEITLAATYPTYADQISQFFTYLNDRCDKLSALQ